MSAPRTASSYGRRSSATWTPSILSTPTTADTRALSLAYSRARARSGTAVGSARGFTARSLRAVGPGGRVASARARRSAAARDPLARAVHIARLGAPRPMYPPRRSASPGPPPPGRRGQRPPLAGPFDSSAVVKKGGSKRKGAVRGTKSAGGEVADGQTGAVVDMKGSGDAPPKTTQTGSLEALVARLARDTRDPDLRRRCRAIAALQPFRSAVTIFSPEGEREYRQLRERVLRVVGRSLETEGDNVLTLPVLDKQSLDRFLELKDDVESEGVTSKEATNRVFKEMDEKLRELSAPRTNFPSRAILPSPLIKNATASTDHKSATSARPTPRRVHFCDSDSDNSDSAPPELTIKQSYMKALKDWAKKYGKHGGANSKESKGMEDSKEHKKGMNKNPPVMPKTVSETTKRRLAHKVKKVSSRTPSKSVSETSTFKPSRIAFLYEGERRDTSSEEEERVKRMNKWKPRQASA